MWQNTASRSPPAPLSSFWQLIAKRLAPVEKSDGLLSSLLWKVGFMRLWLQYNLYHPTLNSLIKCIDFLQCMSSAVQASSPEVATFKPIKSRVITIGKELVSQSCPTLWDPMDCSPPGSSVHETCPGKDITVGYHFLLQGIFPTQGWTPGLLHWGRFFTNWATRKSITTGKRGIIIFIFSSFKPFSKQEIYQYIN